MFGALAIGGAALASGMIGADASKSAANSVAGASDRANAVLQRNYDTTRQDLSGYRGAGGDALGQLMYLTTGSTSGFDQNTREVARQKLIDNAHAQGQGLAQGWTPSEESVDGYVKNYMGDMKPSGTAGSLMKPFDYSLSDFYKDPSYNFRLQQGEQGITRASAASGIASGSPGLKALMRYNQDYASTEYGNAFNRAFGVDQANKQTQYNFLSGIAGMGQNAAAMTGSAGTAAAAGSSQALMTGGQAIGAGTIGAASATNNAVQGGLSNYMYQQRYDQMMQRMPVFGPQTTAPQQQYPG